MPGKASVSLQQLERRCSMKVKGFGFHLLAGYSP